MACIVSLNSYCQNNGNDYYTEQKKSRFDINNVGGFLDFAYACNFDRQLDNSKDMITTSMGATIPFLTPNLHIGAGFGFNSRKGDDDYEISMPLFLITKVVLWNKPPISPYTDVRLGYTFGNDKGWYFSSGLGLHFKTRSILGFYVTCGYSLQSTLSSYYPGKESSMITMRIGMDF